MSTPEDRRVTLARKLVGKVSLDEVKWKPLAALVGISAEALQRAMRPGYREERNRRARMQRRINGEVGQGKRPQVRSLDRTPAEGGERLREIPPDTRSLTGRTFNDPLPGRSALDMEGGE